MFDACDYEKMITLSNNKHLVNADITKKVPELSQKKWFAVLASPLPQRARSFVAIELKGDVPQLTRRLPSFPASRQVDDGCKYNRIFKSIMQSRGGAQL